MAPSSTAPSSVHPPPPPPPVLSFDDGSRAMTMSTLHRPPEDPDSPSLEERTADLAPSNEESAQEDEARRSRLFEERYEMDRVVREIRSALFRPTSSTASKSEDDPAGADDKSRGDQNSKPICCSSAAENDHRTSSCATISRPTSVGERGSSPPSCWGIALQFPEPWLHQACGVCQELERRLHGLLGEQEGGGAMTNSFLVYCVGDATSRDCCPDVVAAQHLPGTRFLVQYGPRSCLSMTGRRRRRSRNLRNGSEQDGTPGRGDDCDGDEDTIQVLHVFGTSPVSVSDCAEHVRHQLMAQEEALLTGHGGASDRRQQRHLLVLYDLRYHHAAQELKTALSAQLQVPVVLGRLPAPEDDERGNFRSAEDLEKKSWQVQHANVGGSAPGFNGNVVHDGDATGAHSAWPKSRTNVDDEDGRSTCREIVVGGLELPWNALNDSSSYSLLYVGDATNQQFFHISLRLQSHPRISPVITFDPSACSDAKAATATNLRPIHSTGWSPSCSRFLKRRYYQVQKVRGSRAVGIVAASLGGGSRGRQVRDAIETLFQLLLEHGRSPYLYSVGKINVAKLSNFTDSINCFVLVACPYQTLRTLEELDRECVVPVVTPMEMATALDCVVWGKCCLKTQTNDVADAVGESCDSPCYSGYSVDLDDFLDVAHSSMLSGWSRTASPPDLPDGHTEAEVNGDGADDDAPYFSLVTGQYESPIEYNRPNLQRLERDLSQLPGQGVLMNYHSTAAESLKQREYQGLRTGIGSSEVRVAIPGQQGIASDYGNR